MPWWCAAAAVARLASLVNAWLWIWYSSEIYALCGCKLNALNHFRNASWFVMQGRCAALLAVWQVLLLLAGADCLQAERVGSDRLGLERLYWNS